MDLRHDKNTFIELFSQEIQNIHSDFLFSCRVTLYVVVFSFLNAFSLRGGGGEGNKKKKSQ